MYHFVPSLLETCKAPFKREDIYINRHTKDYLLLFFNTLIIASSSKNGAV